MRTKIIKKIFNTTVTMFIILTIFTLKTTTNSNVLRTNVEIDDITNLTTNNIYLLNKNNLLVKTKVFINNKHNKEIESIIKYLTITNNKTPVGLKSYIPKDTKLLNYKLENNTLIIDLSKEFLSTANKQLVITGLVYSLLEIKDIDNIKIQVEGKPLEGYNEVLNKSIGINNEFLFNSRYDINRVVIYYVDKIDNKTYFVPVTKYLNDTREKIEIIIDELKENNNNLISYLNDNTKLINYREEGNVLYLNFNEYLVDSNESVSKDIMKTIAYSVFDNYNVNVVCFETNSKRVDMITDEFN